MRQVLPLVVVSLCFLSFGRALQINKRTGGYEDIVVAIQPTVSYDERIIESIKALFTSASSFLHRATRGMVHFGSVTIAVPETWPTRPQATATTASLFPVADVRVAAENPQYGDTPYTLQPRGCGERGEYIHLTPRFLAELNGSMAEIYGSPAYQLVHEWAHFRYGVFDEYGDPESDRYPSLYCESGMVRATSCSDRTEFTAYTDSGEPCRIYKGCQASSKCKVWFSREPEDPLKSSIMFMPYIKGVSDFCDDAHMTHNAFAPTKHNHLCGRRSTWDVIRSNEDFTNLPNADLEKDVRVNFKEVQKRKDTLGRVIFALDTSSSMGDHNRIGHLRVAAAHFLQVLIPDGLEVGLVRFNGSAAVLSELTTVQAAARSRFVQKVGTLFPGGSTCIGCALRTSLQMLKASGQHVEGSVIILMTDGKEVDRPYIADVMDELLAEGVVVHTIAFGTEAESTLEKLAHRTGGKPFALSDGQSNVAAALESAFFDATFATLDNRKKPVVIFNGAANVTGEHKFEIIIDEDLGKEATITVLCERLSILIVVLLYPDGRVCDVCQPSVPSTTTDKYVTIKIPGIAMRGTWTLVTSHNLGSSNWVHVHVRATSWARDSSVEPIMARAFLKRSEVGRADEAVVYAEVSKGPHAVLHARVMATVIRPRKAYEVVLELFDNGVGADVTANDGIYTAYFTQFDGVGRYSFSAHVVSGSGTIVVKGRSASRGLPDTLRSSSPAKGAVASLQNGVGGVPLNRFVYVDQKAEVAEPYVVPAEKAPQFSRYVEGGSFRLNVPIDESTIPPGSIQDLRVEDAFISVGATRFVVLVWTCPGAHMTSGNASWIEVRVTTRLEDLVKDFKLGVVIMAGSAESGNISAGPVGSRQRVRLPLPDSLVFSARKDSRTDFYFVAIVYNRNGQQSAASNIIRVTFERPPALANAPGTRVWLVATISFSAVVVVVGALIWVNLRKISENVVTC